MQSVLDKTRDLIHRFGHASDGVAAVEFALVLPIMLTLYIGSVELSTAISVDKRVATVSGSLGDLVARTDGEIAKSTIDDFFLAASATMAPYSSTNVKQVVSSIYVDGDGNATVSWSVGYNGGTAHAEDSTYDLPDDLKTLALDNYVIVSEASESYAPMFGYFFKSAFDLYHEFHYIPRFGEEITYDPNS